MISRRHLLASLASVMPIAALSRPAQAQTVTSPGQQLQRLGIELPPVPAPVADYQPWLREGHLVYIAGQLPLRNGELLHPGRVGEALSLDQGREAAELAAVNVLAALSAACEGDLSRVQRCLQVQGFVASANDFAGQSQVMDSASALLATVLGEAGRHTRLAVGVNVLPRHAAVEIAATFSLRR